MILGTLAYVNTMHYSDLYAHPGEQFLRWPHLLFFCHHNISMQMPSFSFYPGTLCSHLYLLFPLPLRLLPLLSHSSLNALCWLLCFISNSMSSQASQLHINSLITPHPIYWIPFRLFSSHVIVSLGKCGNWGSWKNWDWIGEAQNAVPGNVSSLQATYSFWYSGFQFLAATWNFLVI